MDSSFVNSFDSKIKNALEKCGVKVNSALKIGVAVSGGADSISLLTSLSHIISNKKQLFVITVNHNLRPSNETEGDAVFVTEYCKKLEIECKRVDIPRGYIISLSKFRNTGIEEAARITRYNAFEEYIKEKNLDYLCLAHNKNDQLETVLMRFLSGGDSGSLCGIPLIRDKYIRPLMFTLRSEIEQYLKEQNIDFKIDSTNSDTAMFRNNIRNNLVPFLNEHFTGWQKGVLKVSEKAFADDSFFKIKCEEAFNNIDFDREDNSFELSLFKQYSLSIQTRIIYKIIEKIKAAERIPYSFISNICSSINKDAFYTQSSSGITFKKKNNRFYLSKTVIESIECGFSIVITKNGSCSLGEAVLESTKCSIDDKEGILVKINGYPADNDKGELFVPSLEYPFMIRSRAAGDRIIDSNGKYKNLNKVFDNYKNAFNKDLIPLIQELGTAEQNIIAVWAQLQGFENWIVKK